MAKYDDASWHYGGNFPDDLPEINGATHIGMFLTWFIENGLLSEEVAEDCKDDIERIKDRTLTGAEFLMNNFDGKLTDDDLNELGNNFAMAYYEEETSFSNSHSDYLGDYAKIFKIKVVNNIIDQKSLYRIENSWKNYDLLKPCINKRFEEWKQFVRN